MTLQDVNKGDIITSARQNEINDYIEHGTKGITTKSVDAGSGDIKTTGNFTDGTNSVTAAQMKAAYDGIIVPQVETKSGSDCSGNDGDTNRVLTLSNTPNTLFLVSVGGQVLYEGTDFTISGADITFLRKLWDSPKILILYFT